MKNTIDSSLLPLKNVSARYEDSSVGSSEQDFTQTFRHSMKYQTINAHKLSEISDQTHQKEIRIQLLIQKNNRLEEQVKKVEKVLNSEKQKTVYGIQLPELKTDALNKELQNAYKQIKRYEYEINLRKNVSHQGNYVEMIRKSQKTLAQRMQISQKLQAEIIETKKKSNQFLKLLTDNSLKKEYQQKSSKLHKQIKFYERELQQQETKKEAELATRQKKHLYIHKLEQQLHKNGFPRSDLEMLRLKYSDQVSNKFGTTFSTTSRQSEEIEDRTIDKYRQLQGEVNLLRKLQKDYTKQIENLTQQKREAQNKNEEYTQQLISTENELKQLQKQLASIKQSYDPIKLKSGLRNKSMTDSLNGTRFDSKSSSQIQKPSLQHYFDHFQIGQLTKKGHYTTDRHLIGNKSARITDLTLYENRTQFLGYQATYLMGQTYKKGGIHLLKRQNQRYLKNKTFSAQAGDYFLTFECVTNQEEIIVGFIAVSLKGSRAKSGNLQGKKRQLRLNPKQYPVMLYGSYTNDGFEMLGIQKVQTG